jgi:hypothetical protein
MKVYFDGVSFEAEHTGPNCFAKRLAIALGNLGVTVADPDDYDVALVFIEPTAKRNMTQAVRAAARRHSGSSRSR